jgi:hypothetical protein
VLDYRKEFTEKRQNQFAKAREAMRKAQSDTESEAMPKALEKMREAFQADEKMRGDYLAKLGNLLDDRRLSP